MERMGASPALDDRSRYLRSLVVRGLAGGNRGHVGSSLSPIEVLRVLYDDVLRHGKLPLAILADVVLA